MVKKATKSELEADLKKTQEELEVTPKEDETPKEEPETTKVVEEDTDVNKEEHKVDVEEEIAVEEEVAPVEEAPKEPDYKEKFSQSSREAQKIHAKNRKLNEGVSKASEITDVTEEELIGEYPDWDVMSDTEKKLARKNLINDKRFAIVTKATEEAKKIEKWGDDVNVFIDDPKTLNSHPELEGKQSDFIEFANQQANHAIPFNILVSAFLHDMSTKKVKNKGKMFEVGSGGPNTKMKPKSDKISIDEAAKLMKSDYKKYKSYLIAGKIDDTIE